MKLNLLFLSMALAVASILPPQAASAAEPAARPLDIALIIADRLEPGQPFRGQIQLTNDTDQPQSCKIVYSLQADGAMFHQEPPNPLYGSDRALGTHSWTEADGKIIEEGSLTDGKDYTDAEMWDRNERAKKRAAKGCYRKGFPEVNIPDAEEGEVFDAEVREIKDNIVYSLNSAPFEKHTEAENMAALGFETEPEKEPAPVETDSPMQSSPAKSTTTMQTKLVEAPAVPALTIEQAEAELSREGDRYGEMASEDLQHRAFGLAKVAPNKRSPIQQFKLDCIDLILKEREKGRPVQVAQPLEGQEALI